MNSLLTIALVYLLASLPYLVGIYYLPYLRGIYYGSPSDSGRANDEYVPDGK